MSDTANTGASGASAAARSARHRRPARHRSRPHADPAAAASGTVSSAHLKRAIPQAEADLDLGIEEEADLDVALEKVRDKFSAAICSAAHQATFDQLRVTVTVISTLTGSDLVEDWLNALFRVCSLRPTDALEDVMIGQIISQRGRCTSSIAVVFGLTPHRARLTSTSRTPQSMPSS